VSRFHLYNVWHVGAWNRNFGDWALAYQMHRLLNEQAVRRGFQLKFYLVDGQRTFFHPALVDHLNEEADLVILGGGGHLFHRPEDKSQSGWMFNISLPELDRIKKPMVVYGIGYNRFPYDTTPFPEITPRHLRAVQERASLFSARNSGSREVLVEKYGLRADKIDLIPDPGVCLYDRPVRIPARRPGVAVVGLNLATDRPHLRYPMPAEENMLRFLTTVKNALLRCVRELGTQIMFVAHLVIDNELYASFAEGFPEGSVFSIYDQLPFLYPPPGELMYPHVPFFTNIFRQADVILGMRGHTCILSFGAGTRFIPLGEHNKVKWFAEDVGVPSGYMLRTVEAGPEGEAAVFGMIQRCLADSQYATAVKTSLARQLGILRAFNDRILDILG
jgi:polysaccharide pyruvyl transferase WcaK-like protein